MATKLILLETVEGLGNRGDHVNVAPGYARNYLLPRRLALLATTGNEKVFAQSTRQREVKRHKSRAEAERLAAKLATVSVTARAQVGEEDRLHGAITSADIAALLKAQDVVIDRHQIQLEEPLKTLGVFDVRVKIYEDIGASIKVWVVKE